MRRRDDLGGSLVRGRLEPGRVSDVEAETRARLADGRLELAVAAVVRGYGPELLTYLVAVARSETDGSDAFSEAIVDVWRGLPAFRWESSVRTWCYTLARRALARLYRAPARRRQVALASEDLTALVAEVRTATATAARTDVKDAVRALREELTPDEQAILILRVDRNLPWRDVARILADEEAPSDAALVRRAAALRKRFEAIKATLRDKVRTAGLRSERA